MTEEVDVMQPTTAEETTTEDSSTDDFLSAFEENESETESQPEDNEAEAEEADVPEAAPEQKHTIRVNHQDIELTYDELIAHAQKGADYDRLRSNYDTQKVNVDRLANLARQQNISVEDLITQAEISYMENVLEAAKDEYIDQGYDEDTAEKLALKDLEIEGGRYEPENEEEAFAEQIDYEVAQFVNLFPSVSVDDIPDEVFDAVYDYDMTLVEAYQDYLIKHYQRQEAAMQQNAKNAQRNVGSARDSKGTRKMDDFLSEFMKE